MKSIDDILKEGTFMHSFLSGGGLRVVRINMSEEGGLLGYGEHPHFGTAVEHAVEDYNAGGRPYKEVYGPIHTHYLTGSSSPESKADAWMLQRRKIDAWYDEGTGMVVVARRGLMSNQYPKDLLKPVYAGAERYLLGVWGSKSTVMHATPSSFANGELAVRLKRVGGEDLTFINVDELTRRPTYEAALMAAFEEAVPGVRWESFLTLEEALGAKP